MQKKQDSLLERVERLSEENSTLHEQLADLQDDIDENLEKYEELLQENMNLQQRLKDEEVKLVFINFSLSNNSYIDDRGGV